MTIQRFCPEQVADRLKLALHTGSCWKPVFVGVYSRFSAPNSTAEVTMIDKIRKVCDTWRAYSQKVA